MVCYSRYDNSDPLVNDVRAALYHRVTDTPGTYHAELADAIDVTPETVRYHSRILEEEGLVTETKIWGKRRLYPETIPTERYKLAAALNDEPMATILSVLDQEETTTLSALSDSIDRSVSTTSRYLDRLEESGLIECRRNGNELAITPTELVESIPE